MSLCTSTSTNETGFGCPAACWSSSWSRSSSAPSFLGIQLPGIAEHTTPSAAAGGEYDVNQGWVRELAPGRYEVNMRARVWAFEPNEIRIPQGSTVTFYIHSDDIIHGFKIQDTTVSLMVFPGRDGHGDVHL